MKMSNFVCSCETFFVHSHFLPIYSIPYSENFLQELKLKMERMAISQKWLALRCKQLRCGYPRAENAWLDMVRSKKMSG
jgi:hypothetical protein